MKKSNISNDIKTEILLFKLKKNIVAGKSKIITLALNSRFINLFELIFTGKIIADTPIIKSMFAILLPTRLPTAIPE
jgi:hypothetical protein